MIGTFYTAHDTIHWRLKWTNELLVMNEAEVK